VIEGEGHASKKVLGHEHVVEVLRASWSFVTAMRRRAVRTKYAIVSLRGR
jgi:hypothetical protein